MNNTQLATAFAEGAIKGKGSNMFIDGDTIYSYGYHFPIAKRFKGGQFLFNSDGYSHTTAKHKSFVRYAIGDQYIECPNCDIDKALGYLDTLMIELRGKQKRARVANYSYQINTTQSMIGAVMNYQFPF